jgi:hypothetical protein
MTDQPHPAINALIGAAGGGVSIIADYFTWLDPAIRAISFYGGRIRLDVDGTLNMAVAGTVQVVFTNITTGEGHIVSGRTHYKRRNDLLFRRKIFVTQ